MQSLAVRNFAQSHRLGLSLLGIVTACAIIVPACGPGAESNGPTVTALTVRFTNPATELRAGQSAVFVATVVDQDGNSVSGNVEYSTPPADEAVSTLALVGNTVTLTAKSPLSAASTTVTVTATVTGVTVPVTNAVASVNIRTRVDNVVLSPATRTLTVGQTLQLAPQVAIAAVSPQTPATVSYNVTQQPAAITVGPTGIVTAVAPTPAGSPAQVTASAEGITSSPVAITVVAAPAATTLAINVTSTPAVGSVTVGSTRQFAIEVRDQFNVVMTQFTTATWTSSTSSVATVTSAGLATCLSAGTVTVRAVGPVGPTGAPLSADVSLSCVAAPSVPTTMSIVVTSTPNTGSVLVGQTRQFAIEVRDQNNAVMTSPTAPTWSFLPATTVATISAAGLATCVTAGFPTVHAVGPANGSGVNLSADLGLTCAANSGNPFASIVLTPSVITVVAGSTATVTASFLDAGGLPTANGCTVSFAVDASPVASVTTSGLVATLTGVGAGTSTLRAFCNSGNVTSLARVRVTQPPLNVASMLLDTHVYLAASSSSNNTFTFSATARDAAGNTVATAPIVWAVQGGNTSVHSIDQTGKVTVVPSVAAGFRGGAVITASSGGQTDYGWFTYGDAGAIRGTVSSTSGQDVGPTTVTATNNSSGALTTSPVSVNGRFFLVGLAPGTYTVSVNGNAPGRSQTFSNVAVTAGGTIVLTVVPFP